MGQRCDGQCCGLCLCCDGHAVPKPAWGVGVGEGGGAHKALSKALHVRWLQLQRTPAWRGRIHDGWLPLIMSQQVHPLHVTSLHAISRHAACMLGTRVGTAPLSCCSSPSPSL